MFDLFNSALLVFINKVRMGISNEPRVPVIRDALCSSSTPPFLQGGAGAGPAADTGPTTAPASPALPRGRVRKVVPRTQPKWCLLSGWWWGERLFLVLLLEDPYSSPWGFPGGPVVKNPPSVQETWVLSMGQEDPLEDEMATHSSILARKFPGQKSLAGYNPWGHKALDMTD